MPHEKVILQKLVEKIKTVKGTSASVFTPSLCVVQLVSECLSPATIPSYINGQQLSTLVDSGSSQSYIHANTVAVLNLKVEPYKLDVSMALSLKGKVDVT